MEKKIGLSKISWVRKIYQSLNMDFDDANEHKLDLFNLSKKDLQELYESITTKDKFPQIGHVRACRDARFYGIDVLELEDEWGFEGYYNGDINHPDPRPAHQIWIKKKDAEKLIRIFYQKFAEQVRKKGYDFAYIFEELNKSEEGKARHSSQA